MFDLTDEAENSPETTIKAKPAEVNEIIKDEYISKDENKDEKPKKTYEKPDWSDKKSDEFNEYEYSDNKELDDKDW